VAHITPSPQRGKKEKEREPADSVRSSGGRGGGKKNENQRFLLPALREREKREEFFLSVSVNPRNEGEEGRKNADLRSTGRSTSSEKRGKKRRVPCTTTVTRGTADRKGGKGGGGQLTKGRGFYDKGGFYSSTDGPGREKKKGEKTRNC